MPKIHPRTKILVFGTFDIIHPGHLNFFKQARRLAKRPLLIVSLALDGNVKKIKGFRPRNSQKRRLASIKKLSLVDEAVLGATDNYLGHILKLRPNIIALGYDQSAYTQGLKANLAKRGLKVAIRRLKPYYPGRYKSSLMAQRYHVDS